MQVEGPVLRHWDFRLLLVSAFLSHRSEIRSCVRFKLEPIYKRGILTEARECASKLKFGDCVQGFG